MTEQRELGIMELLLAKEARRGGWRVGSMIDLEGGNAKNVAALRNTLESLQERHEMLRMRIDVKDDDITWHEDREKPILFRVVSGDKTEVYMDAQAEPMKNGDGILRVFLVMNEGEPRTTLIVLIEHFASDGMSYGNLLHEILLGMSETQEFEEVIAEKLAITPGMEKHSYSAFHGGLLRKFIATYKVNRAMDNSTPIPLPKMAIDPTGNRQLLKFFELAPDQSKKLLFDCRAHGTTLTGLVGAVLAEAYAGCIFEREDGEAVKEYPVAHNLAFDLRRLYGPSLGREHISFQVGTSSPVVVKVSPRAMDREATWKNAVAYKQQIKDHVSQQLPMAMPLILGVLPYLKPLGFSYKHFDFESLNSFDMFFTNWGRIPIKTKYPGIDVLNFVGGINTTTLHFPVAILSSFRGKTGVTVLASKDTFEASFLDSLSAQVQDRLQQLSQES